MDEHIYRSIRFIVLLVCLFPSITCYLRIFFLLCQTGEINQRHLRNHVILALLVCNFLLITTELPITLVYSYYGSIQLQSNQFCSFWVAYNYSLYVIGLFLMSFGCLERYFLIFHERFVYQWRFVIHYPPIVFCFLYPLIFYNVLVNVYPCDQGYDYESYVCAGACYQFQPIVGAVDYIVNLFNPVLFMIFINVVLLVRVIRQKRAMQLANTWRKTRLMFVQLFSISLLYFVIWIPFGIISMIRLFYDPFFLQDVTMLILNYCLYLCPLASPFIALFGLPAVRKRLIRHLFRIRRVSQVTQNRVRPRVIAQQPIVAR